MNSQRSSERKRDGEAETAKSGAKLDQIWREFGVEQERELAIAGGEDWKDGVSIDFLFVDQRKTLCKEEKRIKWEIGGAGVIVRK